LSAQDTGSGNRYNGLRWERSQVGKRKKQPLVVASDAVEGHDEANEAEVYDFTIGALSKGKEQALKSLTHSPKTKSPLKVKNEIHIFEGTPHLIIKFEITDIVQTIFYRELFSMLISA
jgi:hypothetical protein